MDIDITKFYELKVPVFWVAHLYGLCDFEKDEVCGTACIATIFVLN